MDEQIAVLVNHNDEYPNYRGIFWKSPQVGWLVLSEAEPTIYKTTDQGANWKEVKGDSDELETLLISMGLNPHVEMYGKPDPNEILWEELPEYKFGKKNNEDG